MCMHVYLHIATAWDYTVDQYVAIATNNLNI